MSTNKNIFHEQQLLAIKVADLYNQEIKKKLIAPKKYKSVLPSTEMLYEKEVVLERWYSGRLVKNLLQIIEWYLSPMLSFRYYFMH
jgi:hypothetical protein